MKDLRHLTWSHIAGSINSDGAFLKATNTDKSLYYKVSAYNSSQGIYGHEAINEYIAYRVSKELGIPVPPTELIKALVRIDGVEFETYVAVSESFKAARDSRVSFEDFYKSNRKIGESALTVAQRFGWQSYVNRMFLFDFLIFNRDRHGANLEVLESDDIKRLSPLFDNGLSFAVSCSTVKDFMAFDVMADNQVNNFIGTRSLYENLKLITEPVLVNELRESARDRLFDGIECMLSELHQTTIWNILWRRWNYAKTVCDLRPGNG